MSVFLAIFKIAIVDELIVCRYSCALLLDKDHFMLPLTMEFIGFEFAQICDFFFFIINFDIADAMAFAMHELAIIDVAVGIDMHTTSMILIVFILS